MLLFATGIFVRTFVNLTSADPGFEPSNILSARFDPSLQGYDAAQMADFYQRLTEGARGLPGVSDVALADGLPDMDGFGRDGWFFENALEPERPSSVYMSVVSANFFSTLGVPASYREYDMGHEINPDALRAMVEWLEDKVLHPVMLA